MIWSTITNIFTNDSLGKKSYTTRNTTVNVICTAYVDDFYCLD